MLCAAAVSLFILPESPRWLVVNGHLDVALAVIHRVYTKSVLPAGVAPAPPACCTCQWPLQLGIELWWQSSCYRHAIVILGSFATMLPCVERQGRRGEGGGGGGFIHCNSRSVSNLSGCTCFCKMQGGRVGGRGRSVGLKQAKSIPYHTGSVLLLEI